MFAVSWSRGILLQFISQREHGTHVPIDQLKRENDSLYNDAKDTAPCILICKDVIIDNLEYLQFILHIAVDEAGHSGQQ